MKRHPLWGKSGSFERAVRALRDAICLIGCSSYGNDAVGQLLMSCKVCSILKKVLYLDTICLSISARIAIFRKDVDGLEAAVKVHMLALFAYKLGGLLSDCSLACECSNLNVHVSQFIM